MLERCVMLSIVLAAACTPTRTADSAPSHALLSGARLEITRTLTTPPEAGDGPALVELRLTDGRGDQHTFGPVLGGALLGESALLLAPDRALSLGDAAGQRVALDTHVVFVPVVAPDGAHYIYARSEDGTAFTLISRSDGARIALGEGLASIGALHFVDDDRFVFVGGRPGGIAGLFLASTASSALTTCLTNCALRTGQPWGDAFVPAPADLESLVLDGDVLSYTDASGASRSVTITRAER